jgi:hypothetical protein
MGRPRKIVTVPVASAPVRRKRTGVAFKAALHQAKAQLKHALAEADRNQRSLQQLRGEIPKLQQTVFALEHQLEVKRKRRSTKPGLSNPDSQPYEYAFRSSKTGAQTAPDPSGVADPVPVEQMAGVVLPSVYQGDDWK